MAQNHQQVPLTHDGLQNDDINSKITTAQIQKVVPAKASAKGARGLAQKMHKSTTSPDICKNFFQF